jgi:hypothetical protein
MANFSFPPTSRYYGSTVQCITLPGGRTVSYLSRRFVPPADRFAVITEHVVQDGERLDLIAGKYLGDPEGFWRIADGNSAMKPGELTARAGRRLRITLPEGVPGPSNA